MKAVRFHEAAGIELAHEVGYYTQISPALGRSFAEAVEQAIYLAARFPEIGAPYLQGTRRVFPKKFPFSIVYWSRGAEV